MTTRVYCSLDYSRLGIETYEPKIKGEILGETKFTKLSKGGRVRWIYVHIPSNEYIKARATFTRKFSTGCTHLKMSQWRMWGKQQHEEFENRCAILAARIFNSKCRQR